MRAGSIAARAAAAVWIAAAGFSLGSCGGGGDTTTVTTSSPPPTTTEPAAGGEDSANVKPSRGGGFHARHEPSRPAGPTARQILARDVRAYVRALDHRDAARVCALFAPSALDGFRFPRTGGSCSGSLAASMGYRDPRGLPVWRRTTLGSIDAVTGNGSRGRVTATVQTLFADRRQPSIEEDLIYFTRVGGRWLIAQPDALLYRVVGAEPPPQAISPPG